jgi:hypothetical protein
MAKTNNNIIIEDARILFRNFSGKEGQYNREGERNFCVILTPELADRLSEDGWRIKWLKPRDEEEKGDPYIPVSVRFNPKPPRIWLISGGRKNSLTEETCNILDWADIEKVDMVLNPYNWQLPDGRSGVKAYLKDLYVTVVEDELESRYTDVPDSAQGSVGGCGNCEACDGSCHKEDVD